MLLRIEKRECPGFLTPCHVFIAKKYYRGYAYARHAGKTMAVHRYCWELECGPIPRGLVIHHKCRNRKCCNVDHLELRTNSANARDNSWAARTHCGNGHPYTEENTRWGGPNGTHRTCLTCVKISEAIRKIKHSGVDITRLRL